ncbi:PAS domain S-box protein [bacterium]|nr:PAS domain S-box protein [bacterium]
MPVLKPRNESQRLESLYRYKILDTDPEQRFDDLTYLASFICNAPVAMINFIDAERQWVKSKIGTDVRETTRDVAFCAHTILQNDLMVVTDAAKDERFANNPFVAAGPKVRFYAGATILSGDGHALGTICVLDTQPRNLSPEQAEALRALSRQVHDQMELRNQLIELKTALNARSQIEQSLRQNEAYLNEILETSRDGILVEENERVMYMNRAYARLFGCASPEELFGLHLSELAAPEDLERLLDYGRRRARGEEAPTLYTFKIQRRDNRMPVELEASVSNFFHENKHHIITFVRDITERRRNELERERLIADLKNALGKVKTLSGLLPICASCKKIRDDKGYWNQIEVYIEQHSEADFSHGICPDCAKRLYPEEFQDDSELS